MGLNKTQLQFIRRTQRRRPVNFERTLTLGRLNWHGGHRYLKQTLPQCSKINTGDFADPIFKALGAASVDSLDISPADSPTLIHDLNSPIEIRLHGRFTAIVDGGTLEHVFNFPAAIWNVIQLLTVNGTFYTFTPTNNYVNHGFYQLTPDLLQTTLALNDFEILDCAIARLGLFGDRVYHYPNNPDRRIILTCPDQLVFMLCARKLKPRQSLAVPCQNDALTNLWSGQHPQRRALRQFLLNCCPPMEKMLSHLYTRFCTSVKRNLK